MFFVINSKTDTEIQQCMNHFAIDWDNFGFIISTTKREREREREKEGGDRERESARERDREREREERQYARGKLFE